MRFNTFADVAQLVIDYAGTAIPVVVLLCFVAFFFNGGRFIFGAGDEAKDAGERKNWLIWGIFGLASVALLAGGVALLQNFFFINGSGKASRPPTQTFYGQNVPLPQQPNYDLKY